MCGCERVAHRSVCSRNQLQSSGLGVGGRAVKCGRDEKGAQRVSGCGGD